MKNKSLSLILFITATIIVFQTGWITIARGDNYSLQSLNLYVSEEEITPPRGLILDRNGKVLADNKKVFDIYIRTNSQEEYDAFVNESLEDYGYQSNLNKSKVFEERGFQDVIVYRSLDSFQINNVSQSFEKDNRIRIIPRWERSYRYPKQFSHILGYTGPIDAEDMENGYSLLDYVGKVKLEAQFEDYLKGTKGTLSSQGNTTILQNEEQGSTIQLSVDLEIQNKLYSLFEDFDERNGAAGGAGVIYNANSGEILSLVSYPGYDINLFTQGLATEDFDNILNNRDRPLVDKAIGSSATPGSTFKIVTATELLESKTIDKNDTYFSNRCIKVGDSEFCEFDKLFYGNMNIVRAIRKSSNVFFCNYLLQYTRDNDINSYVNRAKLMGVGSLTGIDLVGEVSGQMDSPEVKLNKFNDVWRPGDTCNVAIGQGAILTTPIQMAQVAALTLNPGTAYEPFLVNSITSVRGDLEYQKEEEAHQINAMSLETQSIVREGMFDVAHNSESAVSYYLKDLPNNLHVKTGSAEALEKVGDTFFTRVHGWIVGTFEYNGETYAFSLYQQYGGGSYYLAPLLKDFLQYLNGKT